MVAHPPTSSSKPKSKFETPIGGAEGYTTTVETMSDDQLDMLLLKLDGENLFNVDTVFSMVKKILEEDRKKNIKSIVEYSIFS